MRTEADERTAGAEASERRRGLADEEQRRRAQHSPAALLFASHSSCISRTADSMAWMRSRHVDASAAAAVPVGDVD